MMLEKSALANLQTFQTNIHVFFKIDWPDQSVRSYNVGFVPLNWSKLFEGIWEMGFSYCYSFFPLDLLWSPPTMWWCGLAAEIFFPIWLKNPHKTISGSQ